jgi:hypothetical protein
MLDEESWYNFVLSRSHALDSMFLTKLFVSANVGSSVLVAWREITASACQLLAGVSPLLTQSLESLNLQRVVVLT